MVNDMSSPEASSHIADDRSLTRDTRPLLWERVRVGTKVKNNLQPDSYRCSKLPRLLYRVSSKASMGVNSEEGFESAMCKRRGKNMEFHEQDYSDMAHWIFRHKYNVKDSNSPFISFSASLLTTLQRAEWLNQQRHEDIRIFVIDTQYLEETDLVMSLYTLLKAFGTAEQRPFIVKDAADEFVAWYRLDLGAFCIQYSTLGNEGLYRLVPELRYCGAALGACLAALREKLFPKDRSAPTSMKPQQRLDVSSTLSHGLYPHSIDTYVAFICLRAHGKYGEALKRSMVALLENGIYRCYFDEVGSLNYRSAAYYNWLDTYASGSGNDDMRLYDLMHGYLMQQARDYEEKTAAIAADGVKGLFSPSQNLDVVSF
jgi:hypothetical protein